MMRIFLLLLICILVMPAAMAKSCEKNHSCKSRFHIQNDPYDIERESSRNHVVAGFVANFAINRLLETDYAVTKFGKLSKVKRIWISALTYSLIGIAKDFVYDPDGLSRSDIINNTIGVSFGVALEFTADF